MNHVPAVKLSQKVICNKYIPEKCWKVLLSFILIKHPADQLPEQLHLVGFLSSVVCKN